MAFKNRVLKFADKYPFVAGAAFIVGFPIVADMVLTRASSMNATSDALLPYTWLACGMIEGALNGLGMNVRATSRLLEFPACQFRIRPITDSNTNTKASKISRQSSK